MSKQTADVKIFNMRIDKELWLFLKGQAAVRETSMTEIIVSCIEKHKRMIEKRLTRTDTNV